MAGEVEKLERIFQFVHKYVPGGSAHFGYLLTCPRTVAFVSLPDRAACCAWMLSFACSR